MSYFENRRGFLIYVDLDPVPGSFHTPHSAYQHIQNMFETQIPQYHPIMILITDEPMKQAGSWKKRVSFVLYVDLDDVPGEFHSQESAQNVIRNILRNQIEHYNPLVSLAPADIQPTALVSPAGEYPRIPVNGLGTPS